MIKNIFGNNKSSSKTGFFKADNEKLIEISEILGNGSIASCIESLGFPTNHIHIVYTFDSDKITCLGFKTLSKKLVFILTESPEIKISYSDVQKEINQINWGYEYSSLNINDILEEGINLENFSLDFLKSVIHLKEDGKNTYKSDQLGLFLQFDDGILKAFTSTGWDNSATKWLNNLNPTMIKEMTDEAKQYHQNDIDTMQEVNNQAKSLLGIPNAISNEYIPFHTKKNGNVNFYNLLITHYTKDCNIDDFLFMNKGRLSEINDNSIVVGNFIYRFNQNGVLESIMRK